MKKLAILALVAMSTVAFAGGGHGNPLPPNNPPTQVCGVCETNDINVGAPQLQVTMLKGTSSVANASGSQSYASNNMSSNTYGVDLRAPSIQITALKDSGVLAEASGSESKAQNNLASNVGSVAVNAAQIQVVAGKGDWIASYASGYKSRAIQNFSTNNACVGCQ